MPPPDDPLLNRTTTSREQVSRINRSYFHELSRFQALRRWLIITALAVGVGWCAWGAIDVSRHYSPGAVAAVHAKWENDCAACHVPLSPIKNNTWLTTAASRREADAKCESCHRGPAHHPLQVAAEVGSCASCHADHRGRGNDLNRVADQTCTACHANIAAHRIAVAGVAPAASTAPITRFDNEHHPPFASLASDPGRLKFSHGRHMRAGLTFGPTAATTDEATAPVTRGSADVWTYGMLSAKDRPQYLPAGGRDADPIQLSCNSCHEFASSLAPGDTRTVSGLLASAPPGAYSLPVDFARHCAACHVLPYEGAADARVETASGFMPHGLDAEATRRFLETTFLGQATTNDPRLDRPSAPPAPLPAAPPAADRDETLRAAVGERVAAARTFVRGPCQKCHDVESVTVAADRSLLGPAAALENDWFQVPPIRVPEVWFAKAKFNHQPHRSYDCRLCHAAAYPDDVATGLPAGSPLDNDVVMISGRDSCTECHAPAGYDAATEKMIGGARFDCVECHGYHGLGPHGAP
jgi:hypothetical protein